MHVAGTARVRGCNGGANQLVVPAYDLGRGRMAARPQRPHPHAWERLVGANAAAGEASGADRATRETRERERERERAYAQQEAQLPSACAPTN